MVWFLCSDSFLLLSNLTLSVFFGGSSKKFIFLQFTSSPRRLRLLLESAELSLSPIMTSMSSISCGMSLTLETEMTVSREDSLSVSTVTKGILTSNIVFGFSEDSPLYGLKLLAHKSISFFDLLEMLLRDLVIIDGRCLVLSRGIKVIFEEGKPFEILLI